jgi:hypothetical protein
MVVMYRDGHRISKPIRPHQVSQAVAKVKELKAKGIKAHVVYLTDKRKFPPPSTIEANRNEGKLWCPYCGAWRWFTVPSFNEHAEVGSEEWFLNSFHRQGVKICKWCHISVLEWYVCKANGIFAEKPMARRRKRRTR